MIKNRPATLLADVAYRTLPKLPFALDWTSIPELIRVAMLDLGGVQLVARRMAEGAAGPLRDKLSVYETRINPSRQRIAGDIRAVEDSHPSFPGYHLPCAAAGRWPAAADDMRTRVRGE